MTIPHRDFLTHKEGIACIREFVVDMLKRMALVLRRKKVTTLMMISVVVALGSNLKILPMTVLWK